MIGCWDIVDAKRCWDRAGVADAVRCRVEAARRAELLMMARSVGSMARGADIAMKRGKGRQRQLVPFKRLCVAAATILTTGLVDL